MKVECDIQSLNIDYSLDTGDSTYALKIVLLGETLIIEATEALMTKISPFLRNTAEPPASPPMNSSFDDESFEMGDLEEGYKIEQA